MEAPVRRSTDFRAPDGKMECIRCMADYFNKIILYLIRQPP